MKEFKIEILSPEGIVFKGELLSVSFPTVKGIITVLPGHTNLVTKLNSGEIVIKTLSSIKKITVSGGFIEITNSGVNVVAEFAANSGNTSAEKIKQAIKLAEDMKNKRKDFVNMSGIESQLKKSTMELKSGLGLKRKKM
jgi:F-type H+-transporting ATPase subunit epsilon